MLVLVDECTRQPSVAELGSPRTTVTVTESSEHHVSMKIEDGSVPLYLVMSTEVAALVALRLLSKIGARVDWLRERVES